MVAVLTVLVALPTITVWLVDRNLREQVQRDADLALSTARASFLQAMQTRNAELAGRFRISLRDPAFRQILRLNDSATLENHLTEYVLVEMGDTELAFYVKADGVVFAKARAATAPTVSFDNLAAAADGLIRNAFQGDVNSQNLVVDGRVFDVVAFPVNPTGGVEGVAVFAIPFSNSTLKQIRPPGSEILVLINRQVAASTWPNLEQADGVVQQLAERASHGSDDSILVGGARFRPATGTLDAASAEHGVRYVVLSSIEQRMSAFERTRRALIGVSAAGILISAAIVWFFVRRITRPLVQLRNTAEAVGRGDFSHRIERF